MIDYEVAVEGVTGTSTVISDLKTAFYSFRIYAFNEYFKGRAGSTAEIDLNLASLSSITSTDNTNVKVIVYSYLFSGCLQFCFNLFYVYMLFSM